MNPSPDLDPLEQFLYREVDEALELRSSADRMLLIDLLTEYRDPDEREPTLREWFNSLAAGEIRDRMIDLGYEDHGGDLYSGDEILSLAEAQDQYRYEMFHQG